MPEFPRRSGVLLHPTSLPGRHGIGDLGREAYEFVDFLAAAGQTYWQVLPLSPTGYGNSPYQGLSAFAGNPVLISLERLVEQGHLSSSDVEGGPDLPQDRVDFDEVVRYKMDMLERAFVGFEAGGGQDDGFSHFCDEQRGWLDDLALYLALREAYDGDPWSAWEKGIRSRQSGDLERWRESLVDEVRRHKYLQWQFFEQWLSLKRYANERGVKIMGDIPIFVSLDSADVWANPHLFHLDDQLEPTCVSGVPPDYFSATGQLWGHPLYRWQAMADTGYEWWVARFRMAIAQADVVRIDHFRAFYNYWEVPAGEETAVNGRWMAGPGADVFRVVTAELGEIEVIAEDLGELDEEAQAGVAAIQAEFVYPGMKVLQFAFGGGPDSLFLPHNFCRDWVVYTGTHDNDTVRGWYEHSATEAERDHVRRYIGSDGADIAWDMVRLAWASTARTAITTAQDLLGLGHMARMNTPGSVGPPNWCWRMQSGALNEGIAARLRELTELYGRIA